MLASTAGSRSRRARIYRVFLGQSFIIQQLDIIAIIHRLEISSSLTTMGNLFPTPATWLYTEWFLHDERYKKPFYLLSNNFLKAYSSNIVAMRGTSCWTYLTIQHNLAFATTPRTTPWSTWISWLETFPLRRTPPSPISEVFLDFI